MTEATQKTAEQLAAEQKKADEQAAKAAAKEAKDKEKADKKAAAEAKKAEREQKKKDAEAAKAAKPEKDTKNGITRPTAGVTQLIWIKADELSAAKQSPVERAALVEGLKDVKVGDGADATTINVGTIHTQYGRWRKYYSLSETKEARQARPVSYTHLTLPTILRV